MKRSFLILLAALLLCLPLAVRAEGEETPPPVTEEPEYEPLPEEFLPLERRVLGDWYGDYAGLTMVLSLAEDGSYALSTPGAAPMNGTWVLKDGLVLLDDDEQNALLPLGDWLRFGALDLMFSRQQPETYIPAEPLTDAPADLYDGFWVSHFVGVGDGTILSEAIQDQTIVYIEGAHVALGGGQFEDMLRVFTWNDGALTLSEQGVEITIRLQQDGFLRLTRSGEAPMTVYLRPAVIPGTEPTEVPSP